MLSRGTSKWMIPLYRFRADLGDVKAIALQDTEVELGFCITLLGKR